MTTSATKSRRDAKRLRTRAVAERIIDTHVGLVEMYRELGHTGPGWTDEGAFARAWDSIEPDAEEAGVSVVAVRSEMLRAYGEREGIELPDPATLGRLVARLDSFPRAGVIR